MKTRRIVAALVALFMIVAMMPTAVLGDDNADGTTPGKVTASKVLVTDDEGKPVIDDDGNYTIRISVEGNPVEQTVGANADVVLVIDNSGSMASFVGTLCGYNLSELNPTLENHKKTYECPVCYATYIVVYDEDDKTIMWSTLPDDNLCTGNKGSNTNRMEATRDLGKAFADRILSQSTNKVAVIGFAHNEYGWYWDRIPVDIDHGIYIPKYGIIKPAVRESTGLTNSYQDVESCINAMVANGGTDYTSALQAAYNILNARTDKATRPAYVIFISDGAPGLRGDSLNDKKWNGEEQIAALKEAGVTIFTAGINLNDDEASYLKSMASDNEDEHFINVKGTDYYTQLDSYLTTWANKIKSSPAGTGAVLTDVVSDEFDASLPSDSPATINGNTIKWNIGDIPANGSSIDILVKPKDDSYGTLHPNQSVKLAYKDYNGAVVNNTDLGDPVINLAKLTINYYYDSAKDENATQTIILDSDINTNFTGVSAPAEAVGDYTLEDVKLDRTPVAKGFNYAGIATTATSDSTAPADRTLDIYYKKAAPAVTYPTVTFKIDPAYNNGTINGGTDDISYEVTEDTGYILNNGEPTTEQIAFPYAVPNDATNYYFKWYFNGVEITSPAKEDDANSNGKWSDRTYVVKFIPKEAPPTTTYKVNFAVAEGCKDMGSVSTKSVTKNIGENIVLGTDVSAIPETGYEFVGWIDANGDTVALDTTIDSAYNGKTLFAVFKAKEVAVITGYQLILTSGSAQKEYDKAPLTCNELEASLKAVYSDKSTQDLTSEITKIRDAADEFKYTVSFINYSYTVEIKGSITDPGYAQNEFTCVPNATNADGFLPCEVVKNYGSLTITGTKDNEIPTIINSWLKIENNVIAPAGFEKDSYTYEVYNAKNDKLLKTVTVKANSYKSVPLVGSADVYVVPVDAEVTGYTLTTVSDPSDASLSIKVPDTGVVSFTHIYTVGLNTIDHYAYIFGYEDGTVRPEGDITRAEVATIFFRLLSTDAREAFLTRENSFSDVAPDAWYNTAVSTLANVGIITGYPDGTYDPNGSMTRAELVSLIARFFTEIEPGDSQFNDIEGHWAAKEINEAFINGIIDGYDDGSFKPDQSISRAEAMKIINGILGREIGAGSLSDDMKLWPDNADETAWFYYIVQEATNSHEYEIGDHEEWIAIIPDPVWKDLESAPAED